MCNRYAFEYDAAFIRDLYDASVYTRSIPAPNYNITLTSLAPLVFSQGGDRHAGIGKLGMSPKARPVANARSEGIADSRAWGHYFRNSRCLVPATHFIENRTLGGESLPYAFVVEGLRAFAFLGIYNYTAKNPHPEFVFLTAAPNAIVGEIHDRMPIVVAPTGDESDAWLEVGAIPETFAVNDALKRWPVSKRINKRDVPNERSLLDEIPEEQGLF